MNSVCASIHIARTCHVRFACVYPITIFPEGNEKTVPIMRLNCTRNMPISYNSTLINMPSSFGEYGVYMGIGKFNSHSRY